MNPRYRNCLIMAIIAFAILAFTLPMFAQGDDLSTLPGGSTLGTNAPTGTNAAVIPATFKPLLELLGGKGTWITTVISYFAALSLILAPFGVWIRNKLANMLNSAAASDDQDDDVYLRNVLSNKFYRLLAFILNFANFRMPTLAEFEHALELQKEVATKARAGRPLSSAMGLLFAFLLPLAFFGTAASCNHGLVTVAPGSDPVVVDAEWLAENATSSFDSFFAWERSHTNLPAAIHQTAVNLRSSADKPGIAESSIANLRTATKVYKASKTSTNGVDLRAAINATLSIVNSIRGTMGVGALTLPSHAPSATDMMSTNALARPPSKTTEPGTLTERIAAREGTNYLGVYLGMIALNDKQGGVLMASETSGQVLRWISYDEFKAVYVDRTVAEYAYGK